MLCVKKNRMSSRFGEWKDSRTGEGAGSQIKMIAGNFERKPQKVPETRFVDVGNINFYPWEVPIISDVMSVYFFWLSTLKGN